MHNEGEPIEPDELETLFQPFRRSCSVEGGAANGWGLGLALVKAIPRPTGVDWRCEAPAPRGPCSMSSCLSMPGRSMRSRAIRPNHLNAHA